MCLAQLAIQLQRFARGGPCFARQVRKCRGACVGEESPESHNVRLATALVRLLDSPEVAAEMGSAGRQLALRKFSPEVIAGQYATLYRRLIAKTSS